MKHHPIEPAITAARIKPLLATDIVGRKIYAFSQIASTNDYARRLAKNGEDEGAVIITDSQTRGRGRYHRRWFSPPGKGLWLSVLLRPTTHWDGIGLMSLLAGLAVSEAIDKETGMTTQLKWPNDVLHNNRKVSGILIESETQNAHLVVGIGINVNQTASDFPESLRHRATSLLLETGIVNSRMRLLVGVLNELEHNYKRFLTGDHEWLRCKWLARCAHKDMDVTVTCGEMTIEGVFQTIDTNGAMILRSSPGEVHRIRSGELSHLGVTTLQSEHFS